MDSRDDLAALLAAGVHEVTPQCHHAADEDYQECRHLGFILADTLRHAGWVPGELLAAEQARNATLTDTIQRVEAVLRDVEESTATPIGWEAATRSTVSIAAIRAALDGPGEEDGDG